MKAEAQPVEYVSKKGVLVPKNGIPTFTERFPNIVKIALPKIVVVDRKPITVDEVD